MPKSVLILILSSIFAGGLLVGSAMMVWDSTSVEKPGQYNTKGCVVGGCSGQLCVEEGSVDDAVTTCEYSEMYGCYKNAICGRQRTGECGWIATEAFSKCQNEVNLKQKGSGY